MERYDESNEELIDLGAATEVTKGGDRIGVDDQALRTPLGLSDD